MRSSLFNRASTLNLTTTKSIAPIRRRSLFTNTTSSRNTLKLPPQRSYSNSPRQFNPYTSTQNKQYFPITLVLVTGSIIAFSIHRRTNSPVPFTDRKRHLLTTMEYEAHVGDVEYVRFLNEVFHKQIIFGKGSPEVLAPDHREYLLALVGELFLR